MKFVKLHDYESNSVVIVNGDNIISIEKDTDNTDTTIVYCIGDNTVNVHESPEKIYSMLSK